MNDASKTVRRFRSPLRRAERTTPFAAIATCLLILTACASQPAVDNQAASPQPQPQPGPSKLHWTQSPLFKGPHNSPGKATMDAETRVMGRSVNGVEIVAHRLGSGPQTTFIMGGIHGTERAGIPLSKRLMQELSQRPDLLQGRTVIFVHNANPDGVAMKKRTNVNGVDLNRNFPSKNFSSTERHGEDPLSQPESRALYELINSTRPDRIIALHQPLLCLDYDGPEAQPLAEAMGKHAPDLPVKRLGGRPGSLGSWAGIEGDAWVITVEFGKLQPQPSNEELWQRYGDMMLASVLYPEPLRK